MLLQELKDGLVLRTVETEADRLAFIELSRDYNNAGEGKTCELLLRHHKGMEDRNFFVVEDRPKSLIVASICLIPWTINWEGVELETTEIIKSKDSYEYRKVIYLYENKKLTKRNL